MTKKRGKYVLVGLARAVAAVTHVSHTAVHEPNRDMPILPADPEPPELFIEAPRSDKPKKRKREHTRALRRQR